MRYLLLMAGCLVVTLPLELVLRARVYARWRRLLLTLAPVLAVFCTWDALAIHAHQWSYRHLTGLRVGNVPVEEIAFFLVVPTCTLLTLEAVRRLRPGWWLTRAERARGAATAAAVAVAGEAADGDGAGTAP